MDTEVRKRELAIGETKSRIHWGADLDEVYDLLKSGGIEDADAESVVSDAIRARRSEIRTKAIFALVFACVALAIPTTYFAIQGFVGFFVIGLGPILMLIIAFSSLALFGRSLYRLVTGEKIGPV